MRILITGGAGFIGSNIIRYLLYKYPGYDIINLDRLSYSGNLENLSDVQHLPMYHFVQGDICNEIEVDAIMSQGIDVVIHLASEPHPNPEEPDPSRFIRSDLYGTYVLAEAAAVYKVERFVQISTAQAYGIEAAGNMSLRPATETDELKPLTAHLASRIGAERLAYAYYASHQLPVTMVRFSGVYGPNQYPDQLPAKWITSALLGEVIELGNHGQTGHDWLHVTDACLALDTLLHARRRQIEGEVFNVGSGHLRTEIEVAELVVNFIDQPKQLIQVQSTAALGGTAIDTSKLERLGWTVKKDFHQGIAETITWYQEHKEWWDKLRQPSPEALFKMSLEDTM
jgi:dTDP-glucose 4,6-dehydratase